MAKNSIFLEKKNSLWQLFLYCNTKQISSHIVFIGRHFCQSFVTLRWKTAEDLFRKFKLWQVCFPHPASSHIGLKKKLYILMKKTLRNGKLQFCCMVGRCFIHTFFPLQQHRLRKWEEIYFVESKRLCTHLPGGSGWNASGPLAVMDQLNNIHSLINTV